MKFVALLSGGKDSCYNLLHCRENGHELVAAASLGPEQGIEELDSYLYQTVGQDAIQLVAAALDIPLYRRVIAGRPIELGFEYGGRNAIDSGGVLGDETEDMYALLSTVKSRHPEIEGVSVGAILSNYQRVRVEHVCRRLALTPLCYLWQRHQGELLDEMLEAGMEAILIKVAGIGLIPAHLGKSLHEMRLKLFELNKLYGSHICGEGGEYETLVIDFPLYKSRIKLMNVDQVMHSQNDLAPVAFLRILEACLQSKPERLCSVRIPDLLDPASELIREAILASPSNSRTMTHEQEGHRDTSSSAELQMTSSRVGSWVAVSNIYCTTQCSPPISVQEEVEECFKKLKDELSVYSLTVSQLANVNVYLSSMEYFAPVNSVYATFFGTGPPARACVAVELVSPQRIKLDCTAFGESEVSERQTLHVQGLSYWAPANIGPYSQAVVAGERVFISGQIGMVPSSLALPTPRSLPLETALACQHVERVTNALRNNTGGGWDGHTQLVLYWLTDLATMQRVKGSGANFKDADAPTLFLGIKTLPKDALIEKQVLLHTGQCLVHEDEFGCEETSVQLRVPRNECGDFTMGDSLLHWEASRFPEISASCALVCVRGEVNPTDLMVQLKAAAAIDFLSTQTLSIRLFYKFVRSSYASFVNTLSSKTHRIPPITLVPCHFISTREADDWDYVICAFEV